MNDAPQHDDLVTRLQYLLLRRQTAEMTPEELAELEDLLLTNTDARRLYTLFAYESTEIAAVIADDAGQSEIDERSPATEPPAEEEVARSSTPHTKQPTTALGTDSSQARVPQSLFRTSNSTFVRRHNLVVAIAVAFATVTAVVSWMAFSYLPGVAKQQDTPAADVSDDVVAWLMNTREVEWVESSVPKSTRYKAGQRLAIEKGLVAIRYATGAEVVIEGPAEFVIGSQESGGRSPDVNSRGQPADDANDGFLRLGRLVARCETDASKGFTIYTPSGARAEDLGTEFGVEVLDGGAAEFVVITGTIEVRSGSGDTPARRARLAQNQAAFAEAPGGQIKRHDTFDPERIASMQRQLQVITETSDREPTLPGSVVLYTAFTSVDTTRGDTAANINWEVAEGIRTPKTFLRFDDINGFFPAQDHISVDRNLGTEGSWSTSLDVALDADTAAIDLTALAVRIDARTKTGGPQAASRTIRLAVRVVTATGREIGNAFVNHAEPGGGAGTLAMVDLRGIRLEKTENYTLTLTASTRGHGVHASIDDLQLTGDITAAVARTDHEASDEHESDEQPKTNKRNNPSQEEKAANTTRHE
ncbi:MAG: hypothetical protein MI757_04560 [Pirellulales bacterium]|nr:hypothetical protein [Pirellulales bacterium]